MQVMMLQIPDVLTPDQVAHCRAILDAADWVDGNVTSGFQAALAKVNQQLPQDGAAARQVGAIVVQALQANPLFVSAALPRTILTPLFNRYGPGMGFGDHVDNSIRRDPVTGAPLRTDLSATLFLSDPDDYEGGELVVEDAYGSHIVKLPAGGLILYPASSLHHVTTVTRGTRTASFFWIQSLVRDDAKRGLLLDMDVAIQRLSGAVGAADPSVLSLTGTYHNLLRMWAEV
jgi:PKHD-type hydroxylase